MSTPIFQRTLAVACVSVTLAVAPLASEAAKPPPTVRGDVSALGGYDVLIADRGNNRILLVTQTKESFGSTISPEFRHTPAADDAFFADAGKSIIINLEHEHVIQIIDIASKAVRWQYGELGRPG